jgi:hypothetical protein
MVSIQPYTGLTIPSLEVIDALEAGVVEITRRVEIYEADATTRWYPEGSADAEVARLLSGGVSVDYSSDERRKLDLTLDNSDKKLRPNPNGGLWYDKVIKIFRGVVYKAVDVSPPLAIIESEAGALAAAQFSGILSACDLMNNDVLLGQTDPGLLSNYSWIASYMATLPSVNGSLLNLLFNQGKNIITVGTGNDAGEVPHYSGYVNALNLVPEPKPVTGAYWTTMNPGDATATVGTDVEGTPVAKLTRTSAVGTGVAMYGYKSNPPVAALVAGKTYTLKYSIRTSVNRTVLCGVNYGTGASTITGLDVNHVLVAGVKQTFTRSVTIPSGIWEGQQSQFKFLVSTGANGEVYEVSDLLWVEGTGVYGISQPTADSPTAGAFTTEAATPVAGGTRPSATVAGAQPLAVYPPVPGSTMVTAALMRHTNGALWLDIHLPNLNGVESRKLLRAAIQYMRNIVPIKTWEAQLGEFYIDALSEANFPNEIKITARDATKKMMLSKLSRTSSFAVGTSLKDFVIGQASLSGIPTAKMRLNIGSEILTSEMSFDKGTSRWDMVKSALESFNYERFFDGQGNFIVRQYLDPTTSPTTISFRTGPEGNLVSFERATNDSRIFNHVIVNATPSDSASNPLPYFGEAINEDPASPTRVQRLGDRVLPIDADWLSSDDECYFLAQQRLQITSLESYEMSFSSIYYPWLECGEIIEIVDPDAQTFEPVRFLMDSIDYGLGLDPMGATGKRVTFVGSSG